MSFFTKLSFQEKGCLYSSLSKREIIRKIEHETEAFQWIRWYWFQQKTRAYQGVVGEHSFSIRKIPQYYHFFLPQIQGRVYQESHQTKIKLSFSLPLRSIIFLGSWILCALITFFLLYWMYQHDYNIQMIELIYPLLMCVLAYTIALIGFGIEVYTTKKKLHQLFNPPN